MWCCWLFWDRHEYHRDNQQRCNQQLTACARRRCPYTSVTQSSRAGYTMTIVNIAQYDAVVAIVRDLECIKGSIEEPLLVELSSAIEEYENTAIVVRKTH